MSLQDKLFKAFQSLNSQSQPLQWCTDATAVLTVGQTKLLHFGGGGRPVLLIPSLINKPHIFDFHSQSLIKYLTQRNMVFLIDWGEINASCAEANYGMAEYIATIQSCFDYINTTFSQPSILGYCMGGLMALLFASLKQDITLSVTTLGMPFDFHQGDFIISSPQKIKELTEYLTVIPGHLINLMFTLPNFHNVIGKYIKFIDTESSKEFIETETWVNDSINMSKPLFMECIENLLYNNSLHKSGVLRSKSITFDLMNSLAHHHIHCLVARHDKVVSLNASKAILKTIPSVQITELDGGHLSLVLKHQEPVRNALNAHLP